MPALWLMIPRLLLMIWLPPWTDPQTAAFGRFFNWRPLP